MISRGLGPNCNRAIPSSQHIGNLQYDLASGSLQFDEIIVNVIYRSTIDANEVVVPLQPKNRTKATSVHFIHRHYPLPVTRPSRADFNVKWIRELKTGLSKKQVRARRTLVLIELGFGAIDHLRPTKNRPVERQECLIYGPEPRLSRESLVTQRKRAPIRKMDYIA